MSFLKVVLQRTICFLLVCVFVVLTAPTKAVFASDGVDTSKYTLYAENDSIRLYIDNKSLAIKIVDKSTNYVWSSGREISEEERLNEMWSNRVNSGVMVDYYDTLQKRNGTATILGDSCTVNISKNGDTVTASVWFDNLELGFEIDYFINGNVFTAELKNDSIRENTFVLRAITLFPFFGSVFESDYDSDGYIFVPDGSGALIEYGKRTISVSNPYKNKVYGGNLATNEWLSGHQIYVPVYGMVNGLNRNAFYVEAESGSAYAEIYAYPAGVMLDYYWAGFTFYYRQNYFQPTGNDGSGFSTTEENRAVYDIKVNYTFLSNENANYVGIARDYQNRLVKNGYLSENPNVGSSPLHLSMVGSEIRRSFLWTGVNTFTTVEQATEIIQNVLDSGITPTVSYIGYYQGGRSSFPLHKTNLNRRLGSSGDFEDLIEFTANNNVPLYFATDYMQVNYSASGVSRSRDFVRMVDQKIYRGSYNINDLITFDVSFLNLTKLGNVLKKDLQTFSEKQMNIMVNDAGNLLYSDYGTNINREQAIGVLQDIFSSDSVSIAFSAPNNYMWAKTDRFLDIPVSSTGYLVFTKDVPFLQILLKGYIDYYAEAINSIGNPSTEVLKLIEYGIYPSYHVTNDSPIDLLNTPLNFIFSSEYNLWRNKIIETTKLISSVLSPVANAKIIDHNYDELKNVAVTTYSNNMQVIVNYQDSPVNVNGYTVGAKSAVCEVIN